MRNFIVLLIFLLGVSVLDAPYIVHADGIPLWPDNLDDSSSVAITSDSNFSGAGWIEVSEPPFDDMPVADHYYVDSIVSTIASPPSGGSAISGTLYVNIGSSINAYTSNNSSLVNVLSSVTSGFSRFVPSYYICRIEYGSNIDFDEVNLVLQNSNIYRTFDGSASFQYLLFSGKQFSGALPLTITADDVPYSSDIITMRWDFNAVSDQSGATVSVQSQAGLEFTDVKNGLLKNIIELITNLPEKIGDIISSLFLPSEDYITNKVTEFSDQVEDHLGFLGFPLMITSDLLLSVNSYSGAGSGVIPFPGVPVKLPDAQYQLIEEQNVDLGEWFTKFPELQSALQLATSWILFLLVFARAKHMLSKFFGMDDDTVELEKYVPDADDIVVPPERGYRGRIVDAENWVG